eukprot:GSMAST32.ASY1.ANO1.747.1 assembled CDS
MARGNILMFVLFFMLPSMIFSLGLSQRFSKQFAASGKIDPPQIVTACGVSNSRNVTESQLLFYDMLENFVGSIHENAPGRTVVVYDLGLPAQLATRIRYLWKWVILKSFPFEDYPPHVRDLSNFAWKPIVMHMALIQYPSIIFLDSGVEVVGPLAKIDASIHSKGHWFVSQEGLHTDWKCCGKVLELTHPKTILELQTDAKTIGGDAIMCAGGLQGYTRDCAHRLACIAPTGSNSSNHRFDQSVFSILVTINGFGGDIHRDEKYWSNPGNGARGMLGSIIYLRKKIYPKPYADAIKQRHSLAVVIPFITRQWNRTKVTMNQMFDSKLQCREKNIVNNKRRHITTQDIILPLTLPNPVYNNTNSPIVDLVLYHDLKISKGIYQEIQKYIKKTRQMWRHCFQRIIVTHANMLKEESTFYFFQFRIYFFFKKICILQILQKKYFFTIYVLILKDVANR